VNPNADWAMDGRFK